jgi:hypothetical protein
MKWVLAAAGVGLVGYAVWQFYSEYAKAQRGSGRERQPWDVV